MHLKCVIKFEISMLKVETLGCTNSNLICHLSISTFCAQIHVIWFISEYFYFNYFHFFFHWLCTVSISLSFQFVYFFKIFSLLFDIFVIFPFNFLNTGFLRHFKKCCMEKHEIQSFVYRSLFPLASLEILCKFQNCIVSLKLFTCIRTNTFLFKFRLFGTVKHEWESYVLLW